MVVILSAMASPVVAGHLSEFRWENRILIVIADEIDSDEAEVVSRILADAECALQDRDMLVSWIYPDGEGSIGDRKLSPQVVKQIRDELRLPESANLIAALVGKDGGVKARYKEWPALGEVFALIDGMPMRRSEMHADADDCDWRESQVEESQ